MLKEIKKCTIAEVLAAASSEQEVEVSGWVRTRRDSKSGISFIIINDGSDFNSLQVVAAKELTNYYSEILKLTTGCSITVKGAIVASPGSSEQAYELQASEITIVGLVENPDTYPITPKYHTVEYLREYAHLRPRTNIISAVTRIRHCLSMAIHRFFHERGFYWIHTPIITTNDCEGAGQLFRVTSTSFKKKENSLDFSKDFFGKETFLTVSGQLNVEAYCEAMGKVYTFGPTFRAENSNTSRHLAEFWMVEPEVAFADLKDNAELAIEMIRYLANAVLTEQPKELDFFAKRVDKDCIQRLEKILQSEFIYLDYTQAVTDLLKTNKSFEYPVSWGIDLQSEHERYLTEELYKKPIVIVNYPKEIKSFYMRLNDDGKTVAAMDVIVPGIGEIIGGSQREERYDALLARMTELKMDLETYKWYLDLRRYGTVPHAGYGLGLERMIMYVTGIQNIRDVIPYPRTPNHADY